MGEKRTILLTNDDGIRADGIRALADALSDLGRVVIIAPENEQSASSHAITLDRPLRIKEYGDDRYGVIGTPTDAVLLGVQGILGFKPDLIVSGINHGPNMGEDVFYSGTVAAATEGNLLGISSMAVSLTTWEPVSFDGAAEVSRYLAAKMIESTRGGRSLWNVNVPPVGLSEIRGIKVTQLGSRIYKDAIIKQVDPRGKEYYWIGGGEPGWSRDENSDFAAITANFVSVTPLRMDLTDYKMIFELNRWDFGWRKG